MNVYTNDIQRILNRWAEDIDGEYDVEGALQSLCDRAWVDGSIYGKQYQRDPRSFEKAEPAGLTYGTADSIVEKVRDWLLRPSRYQGTAIRIPFMGDPRPLCPRDTDGDGNCGQRNCPFCSEDAPRFGEFQSIEVRRW